MNNRIMSISLGLMLASVMPLANAIPANIASNLTLSPEPSPGIQQNDQGPCVIGDPSCNSNPVIQPGFEIFPAGGNVGDYTDIFSPEYSIGDFRSIAGNSFSIGIDINQQGNGNSAHSLTAFVALVDGVQEFAYFCDPQSQSGSCDLALINNNGNGFSDWFLSGFDLSDFTDSQTLQFGVDMLDVDAGRDQFFVIAGPDTEVPEPGLLGLLGLGLIGLGVSRRRQRAS